jgi:hypothetical protein
MGFGSVIHSLVGAEQDVIGFDPRGIGATTPRADCFAYPKAGGDPTKDPSSDFDAEDYLEGHFHRTIWATQAREIGLVNSSAESLPKLAARAKAMAHLCEQKDALHGDNSIFRHLSTPSVARDMISIIDAWDEWTESLNEQSECTEPVNLEDEETSTDELPKSENTRDLDTKGKLVYWGFSYGVRDPVLNTLPRLIIPRTPDIAWGYLRSHVSRPSWASDSRWSGRCRPLRCTRLARQHS